MADSLNTTNLSRRSILGTGIAAAGALAIAAVPAVAVSSGSDRKLLQLCRNWHRLYRAHNRAIERRTHAETTGAWPPIPDILKRGFDIWPGSDCGQCLPGHYVLKGYSDPKHQWLGRGELTAIASGHVHLEARWIPGNEPDDTSLLPPPEAARVYARQCLAAHEDWAAARKAHTAQVEHWQSVCHRLADLQITTAEDIGATPAHTVEGLRAKLSIISVDLYCANEGGVPESVVEDVARMIDPAGSCKAVFNWRNAHGQA